MGKQRNENEGFGPYLLHNRRLETLMSAANDFSPIFCKALRRLSLPSEKLEQDDATTPRNISIPKLLLSPNVHGTRPQSGVYRSTPSRRHSVAEPQDLNICARGSAIITREAHKPESTRPPRIWSAGAVRGVYYSRPVSLATPPPQVESGRRASPSHRLRAPLLPLSSDRGGHSTERLRAGAQLILRPRVTSIPLSARHATMQPSPPQQSAPATARHADEWPSDAELQGPSRDSEPAPVLADDLVFDYVSLTIE